MVGHAFKVPHLFDGHAHFNARKCLSVYFIVSACNKRRDHVAEGDIRCRNGQAKQVLFMDTRNLFCTRNAGARKFVKLLHLVSAIVWM